MIVAPIASLVGVFCSVCGSLNFRRISNSLPLRALLCVLSFFFLVNRMFPIFFVFVFILLGKESQECVWACVVLSPGRSGPVGTFYNPVELSLTPPTLFFVFAKGISALLKTRVNGARYRSPEGSL